MKNFLYSIFNYPKVHIENFVKNELSKIPNGQTILDVGAGEMQFKKYCNHLKYMSQDIGEYDGEGNGLGLQTKKWDMMDIAIRCDATSIPVEDNSFDNILCTEVFEHATDPNLILKEILRIIKPGGKIILTAPFYSWTHFAPYHFHTGFNTYWYEHFVKLYGGKIIQINKCGNYYDIMALEALRSIKTLPQLGVIGYCILPMAGIIQGLGFIVYKLISFLPQKTDEMATFDIHVIITK